MQAVNARALPLLLLLPFAAGIGCKPRPAAPDGKLHASTPIAGAPAFALGQTRLADLGYIEEEYFFSGTASSYRAGPAGYSPVVPAATAPYKSRLVVIRPTDPAKFNGTVLVEWLNVTSGADASPEWTYTHRELLREGFAYAGVSAQKAGIEAGPSLFGGGKPLKVSNPKRYTTLHHPGDEFSFDIFSQAAAILRGATPQAILGPLKPTHLIAAGESQSAAFLTTYIDAIDPIARQFDGFLVHSRFGFAAGLDGSFDGARSPVPLRADLRVPVLTLETETELIGPYASFIPSRQPDSDRLRTWELAGAAHADQYLFGPGDVDTGSESIAALAAAWQSTAAQTRLHLDSPINAAPQHHYVDEAAVHHLNRWIAAGEAPSHAPPIEVDGAPPKFTLDRNGNALGGVRTPWMDVPTEILSGVRPPAPGLLGMLGQTRPFTPAQLKALYPGGKPQYLARFQASLDAAIRRGFILPADRAEILALAAALYPSS